ncbi:MAG: transcription termination factor Rho [Actinobacteria bacterium]|nr:transcription termination factor Rho [Actinomycetota bacterium]
MVLPQLQEMATGLGITGVARMRKSDLIEAIKAKQSGAARPAEVSAGRTGAKPADASAGRTGTVTASVGPSGQGSQGSQGASPAAQGEQPSSGTEGQRGTERRDGEQRPRRDGEQRNHRDGGPRTGQQREGGQRDGGQRDRDGEDEGDGGGRSRRGRRFRDRRGRTGTGAGSSGGGVGGRERFGGESEPVIAEDDVLVPVAGILDILDNYAFIRTSGYLPGPNDIYVSLSQVRKNGLRRGDAITGSVRQPREGERRDKFNALVRLDTVNGVEPDQAKNRPEFTRMTPLYPQDRLRLETEPHILTTRVIDLVVPIGKGQRALIVSPPKAGKTMVLQAIANAITHNNPECHLMVVLVDERPEEVTDMQRSVKGEVIASTFDRPPTDHTTVAELSIERAKRLVELGHDVVVLLDSITRLGRAYNNSSPASGRILSGGIDSTALYPPKRFLGAARNIEHGGSLTIIATALVETGSTGDTVIFEEFKGTGNAELKLDRKIADKRVFPAVDVMASSTRKEEILLAPEELAIVVKLRRVLHGLDPQQAIDLLLDKLKETRTNVEFLMQVQKTTVSQD